MPISRQSRTSQASQGATRAARSGLHARGEGLGRTSLRETWVSVTDAGDLLKRFTIPTSLKMDTRHSATQLEPFAKPATS